MNVPAIACGVLVASLVATGALLKLAWMEHGRLEVKLADAQAVIDQREQDAKLNAVAVTQLAQKLNDTETKVITVTEKVYAEPRTDACAKSPSMRAASGGLRELFPPQPVQAPGRREPTPAVR